jgi:hypothetical protein
MNRYSFNYHTHTKSICKSISPCLTPPLKGSAGRQHGLWGLFILTAFSFLLLQSCVVYRPVPVPAGYPVNSYEIAWVNAQRAAEDVGIRITSADKAHGTIEGQADQTDVTIHVIRLPDGRIRLEVNLRGPSQESYIADEFNRAYQRRVGTR